MPAITVPAALSLFALAQAVAPSAAPSPRPSPGSACASAAFRQFDFWIGEWEVVNQRPPAGRTPPASKSRITRILDGCAVLEEYETANGYAGKSLNFHDAKTGRWNQVWIDNGGTPLFLKGRMEGASMVMRDESSPRSPYGGTRTRAPHGGPINRITWTPVAGGKVRQLWETSKDGGRTWEIAFDGMYSARPAR